MLDDPIKKISSALSANSAQLIIARAPGRINLIGEHTDYNHGLVLPAAISQSCYFGLKANGTQLINAVALDLDEKCTIDLTNLSKTNQLWANFLSGILLEFKKRNIVLHGFDCALTSEVPIGAGMSSSSALECSILTALNHFYGAELDNWELITMSQSANHEFIGIQGGILDQFASLFGQKDKVMLMDCSDRSFQYITQPTSDYTWLLIDTCVKHNHLTSAYNDRVQECQQALEHIQQSYPDILSLSEIHNLSEIAGCVFDKQLIENRAHYVIEENERVRAFVSALLANDLSRCGDLLYAAHDGLANKYEVSCPELDYLVELSKTDERLLGARMMGGGFGGCTINLIHKSAVSSFRSQVASAYTKEFNIVPEFYEVELSAGAELVK